MLTESEREELDRLRREDELRSLGDRPSAPAAKDLRRLLELERKASAPVPKTTTGDHLAIDDNCPACEREGMCADCESAWLESK